MAEGKKSDSLPVGWILKDEVQKDGSKSKCFTNVKTGQTFYTEEDLHRYVNYVTSTLPKLNAGWTRNSEGQLLPPGEGGSKNKDGGESSSIPTLATDPQLKNHPLEIEIRGEKRTKPGSEKPKNKKKRQVQSSYWQA